MKILSLGKSIIIIGVKLIFKVIHRVFIFMLVSITLLKASLKIIIQKINSKSVDIIEKFTKIELWKESQSNL